jgi:quinol monooxygenase YgiN
MLPSRSKIPLRTSALAAAMLIAGLVPLGCNAVPSQHPSSPSPACAARIARTWHGRTPNEKADAYAAYIGEAIKKFRKLQGNLGYQLMRETVGAETHFTVISSWSSRDEIKGYAGEDIRKTRHLPRDAEFLIDPEQTVMNYDLVVTDLGCAPQAPR